MTKTISTSSFDRWWRSNGFKSAIQDLNRSHQQAALQAWQASCFDKEQEIQAVLSKVQEILYSIERSPGHVAQVRQIRLLLDRVSELTEGGGDAGS